MTDGTCAARAVWITAERRVELRDESAPPPGPGELRVRALASAISHGTEMLAYRGQLPHDLALDLPTLAGSFALPIKYGYASVGDVVDVGPDVTTIGPGERVFVLHPHQTTYTVPAALAVRLPAEIDPLRAVFCANLETALNVVHDTPLRLGETAVVFGLGTVGQLVTQLLLRGGAAQVVGIDPVPARRALAARLGVGHVLDAGPEVVARLHALTGGRGADVAIEVSGAAPALQHAIDGVATEGTVVVASWYGDKPVELRLGGHFHRGRVRLRSSQVGRLNPETAPRWDHTRRMQTVVALLEQLPLEALVSHRVPIERAADAYRLIDERPAEVLQVVLTCTGDQSGEEAHGDV